jgi:hypothetical protein
MTENISTEIAVVKADVGNFVVDDPVLTKCAAEIRRLGRRVKEDVVEIGRYLDEAQQHAGHGTWLTWIEAEFGWSDQTARRFIHVYEFSRDSKFNKLLNSNLPLSALYQLAAPKTPEAARKEVAARVEAGEKVSVAAVTKAVGWVKAKKVKTTKPADDVDAAEEDPSVTQRRTECAALFGESADSAESELTAVESAGPAAEKLLEYWTESTPQAQQFIRDLVIEEFFAQADGADIYARIPADRLDEVIPAFLDKLTVEGMRTKMSEAFGQSLRRKEAAPAQVKKSAKGWKKSINHHPTNSARNGRGTHSRQ